MPPFTLHEVNSLEKFYPVMSSLWTGFENPKQNFFSLFCYVYTTRDEAIKESAESFWAWNTRDPSSKWFKLVDDETGKIVGGTLWKVHDDNPFAKEEDHEVTWHPEGGRRQYVSKALEIFETPRMKVATYKHVFLNIIWIEPEYRRHRLGSKLMEWGIQKADELGYDMWLNATVHGMPLYQKYGFRVMCENDLRPTSDGEPDQDWIAMDKELTPMVMYPMWRPKAGEFKEGETKVPWEGTEYEVKA